jgi:hypothetical protein
MRLKLLAAAGLCAGLGAGGGLMVASAAKSANPGGLTGSSSNGATVCATPPAAPSLP